MMICYSSHGKLTRRPTCFHLRTSVLFLPHQILFLQNIHLIPSSYSNIFSHFLFSVEPTYTFLFDAVSGSFSLFLFVSCSLPALVSTLHLLLSSLSLQCLEPSNILYSLFIVFIVFYLSSHAGVWTPQCLTSLFLSLMYCKYPRQCLGRGGAP